MEEKSKEIIKVFIILGEKDSLTTTKKIISESGQVSYSGYCWEIFKKIKEKLKHKYIFKVLFSEEKQNSYSKFIKDMTEDKYDIIIGEYFITKKRKEIIDYSFPISINSIAILHFKKQSNFKKFVKVIQKVGLQFLFLLLLGIFFGILLHFIEKGREYHSDRLKKSNKLRFLRSIVTGVSTMFGEMGYLSERSSLTIRGIILITIIMAIAFLSIMYIQGEITTVLINNEFENITKYNISSKRLLGYKGYSANKKLKRFGANIHEYYKKGLTENDFLEYYIKNRNNYDGVIFSYSQAFEFSRKRNDLNISFDFGNELISFPVNKNKKEFLQDINLLLLELRDSLELQKICQQNYGDIPFVPVCSLT